jgi:hypothetical protein
MNKSCCFSFLKNLILIWILVLKIFDRPKIKGCKIILCKPISENHIASWSLYTTIYLVKNLQNKFMIQHNIFPGGKGEILKKSTPTVTLNHFNIMIIKWILLIQWYSSIYTLFCSRKIRFMLYCFALSQ